MRIVHKYPLKIEDGPQPVETAAWADPVLTAMQGDTLCLWMETAPDLPKRTRFFSVYGTGHPVESQPGFMHPLHVGSCVDPRGFVWHVYEHTPQR